MPFPLPLTPCGVAGRAGAGQTARTGTARSPPAAVPKSLPHNLGPDLVSTSSALCKLLPVTFPERGEEGGGMGGHVSGARPSCQRAEGALALHIPLPPGSRGLFPSKPSLPSRSGPGMPEHPRWPSAPETDLLH